MKKFTARLLNSTWWHGRFRGMRIPTRMRSSPTRVTARRLPGMPRQKNDTFGKHEKKRTSPKTAVSCFGTSNKPTNKPPNKPPNKHNITSSWWFHPIWHIIAQFGSSPQVELKEKTSKNTTKLRPDDQQVENTPLEDPNQPGFFLTVHCSISNTTLVQYLEDHPRTCK